MLIIQILRHCNSSPIYELSGRLTTHISAFPQCTLNMTDLWPFFRVWDFFSHLHWHCQTGHVVTSLISSGKNAWILMKKISVFHWLVSMSGYKKRLLVHGGGTCSTECHSNYVMYFISQCVCVCVSPRLHPLIMNIRGNKEPGWYRNVTSSIQPQHFILFTQCISLKHNI